MSQGTKIYRIGKDLIGIEYPEIYFHFVSLLHREHDDLLRAMALAQVRFEDFTAVNFLNRILGTNVTQQEPMEVGFKILYDALKLRSRTSIAVATALRQGEQDRDSVIEYNKDKLAPDEMFPMTPTEKKDAD